MSDVKDLGPPPEYRVGQIWADRKRRANSVFVITHVYDRVYQDGRKAERVVGIQSHKSHYDSGEYLGYRPIGTPTPTLEADDFRDLDARSMERMYPHKMWEPYDPEPEEDK